MNKYKKEGLKEKKDIENILKKNKKITEKNGGEK
jgi:hypothetical protein